MYSSKREKDKRDDKQTVLKYYNFYGLMICLKKKNDYIFPNISDITTARNGKYCNSTNFSF